MNGIDAESVISFQGLAVMADPSTHVTQEQLREIQHLQNLQKKKNGSRHARLEMAKQKKIDRVETASLLSGGGEFPFENRVQKKTLQQEQPPGKDQLWPETAVEQKGEEPWSDGTAVSRRARTQASSAESSVDTEEIFDANSATQASLFGADRETHGNLAEAVGSKMRNSPSETYHKGFPEKFGTQGPGELPRAGSGDRQGREFGFVGGQRHPERDRSTNHHHRSRARRKRRHNSARRERHAPAEHERFGGGSGGESWSSGSTSGATVRSAKAEAGDDGDGIHISRGELDSYLQAEISHKIKEMEKSGIPTSTGFDAATASKWRLENEHWRMKMSLDEQQVFLNCEMFVNMGAQLAEGFCSAIDLRAFKTKGLSKAVSLAVKGGSFNSCIRAYANSGGGLAMMKDPTTNFLTTASSILIKNHLNNQSGSAGTDRQNREEHHASEEKVSGAADASFRKETHTKIDSLEQNIGRLTASMDGLVRQQAFMCNLFDNKRSEAKQQPSAPAATAAPAGQVQERLLARSVVPDRAPEVGNPVSAEQELEAAQSRASVGREDEEKSPRETTAAETHPSKEERPGRNQGGGEQEVPKENGGRKKIRAIKAGIDLSSVRSTLNKITPSLKSVNECMDKKNKLEEEQRELDSILGIQPPSQ